MLIPKQHFIRDNNHLRFVASLPCCVTGAMGGTQSCHIRTGNGAGLGIKSGDDCVVPMHFNAHATQHSTSEKDYWRDRLDEAKQLARDLYAHTGNEQKALELIAEFRSG